MDEELVARWRCRNGHTLGLVVRRGGVRVLLLFREALGAGGEAAVGEVGVGEIASQRALAMTGKRYETNEEVEVMAVLEGDAAEVRCSVCGSIRMWVADGRWLRKKLKSYKEV